MEWSQALVEGWASPVVSSIGELVMGVRASDLVLSQPLSEILILKLPTTAALPAPRPWAGSPAIDVINHGTCPPPA
jgi:hypothetical protein